MAKPDIFVPTGVGLGRGRQITTDTNLVAAVSGTLYYQLMVFWHAIGDDRAQEKYNDKVYDVFSENFGRYMDAKARAMPKKYHHVYEWSQVGQQNGRLWRLKRNKDRDGISVRYTFVQSKRVAPIHPVLREPGPTGKVVKRSAIFRNKAFVMEEGLPVTVRRRGARWLAIPAQSMLVFSPGKNIIFSKGPVTIPNPGGNDTKLSFARTFSGYFSSGLAMKELKSSGVLDTPARITKRAGENVPSAISRATFSRGVDKQLIDRLAEAEVSVQAGREY